MPPSPPPLSPPHLGSLPKGLTAISFLLFLPQIFSAFANKSFLSLTFVFHPNNAPTLKKKIIMTKYSSAQFCRSVVSDSLRPHELQHDRPPCLHDLRFVNVEL